MTRNFGIPPRDPDNGDPPLLWKDDHWEVAAPEDEGVWVVGAVYAVSTLALLIGVLWVVARIWMDQL